MASDVLALRWHSEKRQTLVSHVQPVEPVRVESLDVSSAGQTVQVFLVPERMLRRLLHKMIGRVGVPQVPLRFDLASPAGQLSEVWNAAQFPPPHKPTRYVASLPGAGTSGPLIVTDKAVYETDKTIGGGLGLDGAAIAALTGLPIPVRLDVNDSRRTRLTGTAYGIVDPPVEMQWMTTGGGDQPLDDYLESYLRGYSDAFGLPSGELLGALHQEYRDCFENPARIGAEFVPSVFEIGEGESVEVDLDLYPQTAGRALAAVALVDTTAHALLTVSDLMVITFTEDGLLFVDS